VYNSIFWGNNTEIFNPQNHINAQYVNTSNTIVEGGYNEGMNTNLITVNPSFVDPLHGKGADSTWFTADDGFGLGHCSSGINNGVNIIANTTTKDASDTSRVIGEAIDIGAYEYTGNGGCAIHTMSSTPWYNRNTWNIARLPLALDSVTINSGHIINLLHPSNQETRIKSINLATNAKLNLSTGLRVME
jgi:hypothetical protein